MRRAKGLLGVIVGLMLLAQAGGSAVATNNPPGNNGDIKIHAGNGEPDPINKDEPNPGCSLHIHGFNFDSNSSGRWWIEGQGGNGGPSRADGNWTANANGEWRSRLIAELADGHYKANAEQTAGTPGSTKNTNNPSFDNRASCIQFG